LTKIVSFRFNQGGKEENAIVTSTGQYVIAWDFAKVKKGQFDKYEIKKYIAFFVKFGGHILTLYLRYTDEEIVRCPPLFHHQVLTPFSHTRSLRCRMMFWLSTRITSRNRPEVPLEDNSRADQT
jgi:hypothetical protein